MADQEEPDHTEDPREQDIGKGRPETQEEGAADGEEGEAERDDEDV